MKLWLISLLAFPVSMSAQQRWVPVVIGPNGRDTTYFDTATIGHDGMQKHLVWVRTELHHPARAYDADGKASDFSFTRTTTHYQIDCAAHLIRELETHFYDEAGNSVYSSPENDNAAWRGLVPETTTESVTLVICKRYP